MGDAVDVMGDQNNRGAECFLFLDEFVEDIVTAAIDASTRFVKDDQLGLMSE